MPLKLNLGVLNNNMNILGKNISIILLPLQNNLLNINLTSTSDKIWNAFYNRKLYNININIKNITKKNITNQNLSTFY